MEQVLANLDPLVATPRRLSENQLNELVTFVRDALLDPRALPQHLRRLVPKRVPCGRRGLTFEFPSGRSGGRWR
jgi:hypothetical protein